LRISALSAAVGANLPVQPSTKIELAINLKTAEALGPEVSTGPLVRADPAAS
jgi:hypothetical protein